MGTHVSTRLRKSKLVRGAKKNAPTILTITGVACFGVAIFTAIRETPKYEQYLEEEQPEKTVDKVKIAAKVYWPTAVIAGLGVASLVGANYISTKRQKALSVAYMGATEALQRYQKHVVEHLDEETVKKIEESVAKDDISAAPKTDTNTIEPDVITDGENTGNLYWVYDRIGNRYFKSNEDKIRAACAQANSRIMLENYISFNELCDTEPLSLPWIPIGDMLEWNMGDDNYSEIGNSNVGTDYICPKFINGQMPDGTPCKEWTFEKLPVTQY